MNPFARYGGKSNMAAELLLAWLKAKLEGLGSYRNPFASRGTPERKHNGRLNRLVTRQRTVNAKRMVRFVP